MTLTSLLVHDVTILTPGYDTNRYGDEEKDWTEATSATVKGWVSQRSGIEDRDHREAQASEWVLFLHTSATITGFDRVTWAGITFEVDGPILPAWSPRGEHHQEVPLRVVAG